MQLADTFVFNPANAPALAVTPYVICFFVYTWPMLRQVDFFWNFLMQGRSHSGLSSHVLADTSYLIFFYVHMGHPVVRCWDCVRLFLFFIREKSHDATQRRRCCTNETLGSSRNDSLRIVAALERRKRGLQCPSQGSYVEELRLSCGKSWECFFYQ